MLQVLLVHDTGLLRSGLEVLVSRAPDLSVRTADWNSALSAMRAAPANVCIVDVEAAGNPALQDLARAQRRLGVQGGLLVLAAAGRPGVLRAAVDAGALGFVDCQATPERLLAGIREVAREDASSTTRSPSPSSAPRRCH